MAFFFAPYQIRGRPGPRRARRARRRGRRRPVRVALVVPTLHVPVRCRRATSSVFHGGFLLVDLATLLVIAAVVHPRSDVGPDARVHAAALDRAALVQPLSLALPDLLRHPARPRRPAARLAAAASCASCSRSARPSSRTATSRRPIRGGAIGRYLERLRTEHGARRAAARAAARIVGVARGRSSSWSGSARASRARRASRRADPRRRRRAHAASDKGNSPTRRRSHELRAAAHDHDARTPARRSRRHRARARPHDRADKSGADDADDPAERAPARRCSRSATP